MTVSDPLPNGPWTYNGVHDLDRWHKEIDDRLWSDQPLSAEEQEKWRQVELRGKLEDEAGTWDSIPHITIRPGPPKYEWAPRE